MPNRLRRLLGDGKWFLLLWAVVGLAAFSTKMPFLLLVLIGLSLLFILFHWFAKAFHKAVVVKFWRLRRIRMTKWGWGFVGLSLSIGTAATHSGINLLFLLLGMMLSTIVVSGLFSELSLKKIRAHRFMSEHVFAGDRFVLGLKLQNMKRFFASYSIVAEDIGAPVATRPSHTLRIPPSDEMEMKYETTAPRRGVHEFHGVRLLTRFPFGFFEKSCDLSLPGSLRVYPALGSVSTAVMPERWDDVRSSRRMSLYRDGEREFHGLREYRYGDNPHWIHWKSSAKLGKPLVREFERERLDHIAILLDTFLPPNIGIHMEEKLELAVSFAASLARDLLAQGYRVSLAGYMPELVTVKPEAGQGQFFWMLRTLAELRPSVSMGLDSLVCETALPRMRSSLTVMVRLQSDQSGDDATTHLRRKGYMLKTFNVSDPSFEGMFSLLPHTADVMESTEHAV